MAGCDKACDEIMNDFDGLAMERYYETEIFDLLKSLQREKDLTVVAVLHDLNIAARYCDRFLLLNKGRVRCMGGGREVMREDVLSDVYGTAVKIIEERDGRSRYIYAVPRHVQ